MAIELLRIVRPWEWILCDRLPPWRTAVKGHGVFADVKAEVNGRNVLLIEDSGQGRTLAFLHDHQEEKNNTATLFISRVSE